MTWALAGLITLNGGRCGYRARTRRPLTFSVFADHPLSIDYIHQAQPGSVVPCVKQDLCVSLLLQRLHHSDRSRAAAL